MPSTLRPPRSVSIEVRPKKIQNLSKSRVVLWGVGEKNVDKVFFVKIKLTFVSQTFRDKIAGHMEQE